MQLLAFPIKNVSRKVLQGGRDISSKLRKEGRRRASAVNVVSRLSLRGDELMVSKLNRRSLQHSLLHEFSTWSISEDVEQTLRCSPDYDELEQLCLHLQDSQWYELGPYIALDALPLLTDYVFTSLLPTCLLKALQEDCGDFVLNLINRIAPPWRKGSNPRFYFNRASFTRSQIALIKDVLMFFGSYSFSDFPNVQKRVDQIVQRL